MCHKKNCYETWTCLQGANLNVPDEELLRNMDQAYPGGNFQGAKRNVPQEEMLLNMDHAHPGATRRNATKHAKV